MENGVTNLLKSLQGNNIKVIFVSGARPGVTHIRQHYICLPKGIVHPKIQITDYPLCLWFATSHFDHFWIFCFPLQANSTMQVNSLQIPESDTMATNGVIHFVNHILYPGGKFFFTLCDYKRISLAISKTKTHYPFSQISPLETRISSGC